MEGETKCMSWRTSEFFKKVFIRWPLTWLKDFKLVQNSLNVIAQPEPPGTHL